MESKPTTLISLRVDPDVARAFKVEAAKRDLKLNAFFEELFKAYVAASGERKRGGKNG
ncbi:MAG TPA: hypothetical protein PKW21_15000 [Rhabdaerophilum sp.]|nr:hypothetical protein [Rhabdaerophilum sp.]